jgi:hypothetical protein
MTNKVPRLPQKERLRLKRQSLQKKAIKEDIAKEEK